jgi:four helix bundle protein
MHPFRRLKVWHKANELSLACQQATFHRPASGAPPGFRSQFLRAIDAIADNIAEGAGQSTQRQFARYLGIGIASSDEADNQLERGRGIGVFDRQEARALQERLWEVRRMLIALRRAVERRADEEEGKKVEDADTDETEGDEGTQETN